MALNQITPFVSPLVLACLALGCGERRSDRDDSGVQADEGIHLSDAADGGQEQAEGDAGGTQQDGGSPEIRFDLPAEGDAGEDPGSFGDQGCDKVDLLFVIDNSGSMADEQINLVQAVPGFIAEIEAQLAEDGSYHVGVISTDLYAFDPSCPLEGAMITQTGGVNSSDAICGPFAQGNRYMTEADDLAETFTCAAQIGTGGDGNERPMQTMLAAISPAMVGPEGCNAGFLRDDALLVIVVISDEEDDHEIDGCKQAPASGSEGDPALWFEGVIATKGDIETNVVVLALVGPPGPEPAECPALDKCQGGIEGAEIATRVVEFTQMFSNGVVGRVCEPTYADFFADAISVIETACENYQPIE